ncbi:14251_t:CDS:2, partial [Cetraspora pellucida]
NKSFMFSNEEDSDPQYSVTFEHDCHGELIIDYELVEVANDNEQDYVNIEMNIRSSSESVHQISAVEDL